VWLAGPVVKHSAEFNGLVVSNRMPDKPRNHIGGGIRSPCSVVRMGHIGAYSLTSGPG